MKFSCFQNDILSSLQITQKASSKNPSPIYQYTYIEAKNSKIKLVGTSASETVMTEFTADIEEEGIILAPSDILREILSKMPSVTIMLDINDKNVMTVSYINMKYNIQCLSAASFSFIDNIEEEISFKINTNLFKTAVKQTYFTAASADVRPLLSGIYIKADHGDVEFAATDGTRISIKKLNINKDVSFEIIVPAKFTYDIMHTSADFDETDTLISFNSKYVKITCGKTTSIFGLISGKYINYQSIIPQSSDTTMICDKTVFLSILERAVLLSDESYYTVKFDIQYSKLYVSSASDSGEGFEEIQVKTDGNPLTIAFNSRNFIEILRNIENNTLIFEFTTGTRVCKIKPAEADDIMYLIFPLRM